MEERIDVSENRGTSSEAPLKSADARTVCLTGFKGVVIGLLALGIALALYIPTPSTPPHLCCWQRYVGVLLFAVPGGIILFCKEISFCTGKLRVCARFVILFVVAMVGWKMPGWSNWARYYWFPNHNELSQQLESPDQIVFEERTEEKVVALTFDDGPIAEKTNAILDVLRDEGVHATFFILGCNLAGAENVLKREVQEGHEIGNHSWSHPRLTECLPSRVREELERCNHAIGAITGKKPVLVRPPYGAINLMGVHCMQKYGLKPVLWTISTKDWLHLGDDSVLKSVTSDEQTCVPIVLMHDHGVSPQALHRVIQWYKLQGYRFVTISELLEFRHHGK